VQQHRLVTQLRTNPAAFGLIFDLSVTSDRPVNITALATASHITCPHPLGVEIAVCEGGAAGKEATDASLWRVVFRQDACRALPQIWECDPESPAGYGVLPLAESILLAPGARVGIAIRTTHPHGIILRALQPSSAQRPETRPGTGRARFEYGDLADSDKNLALFAGRVPPPARLPRLAFLAASRHGAPACARKRTEALACARLRYCYHSCV